MDCRIARQYIHAELDGELPAERQAALGEHLRACDTCRSARLQLQAIRSAMRRLAAASEPAELAPAPIPFSAIQRAAWPAIPAWGWAAAAVIVLCLAGWMAKDMVRHSPAEPSPVAIRPDRPAEPPVVVAKVPQPAPRETAEITIQTPPDTIVVPYKTQNPRVKVFWLYKVTTTVQNSEPADPQTDRPM